MRGWGARSGPVAVAGVITATALAVAGLSGCQQQAAAGGGPAGSGGGQGVKPVSSTQGNHRHAVRAAPAAVITTDVSQHAKKVPVDTRVSVAVGHGRFDSVVFTTHHGRKTIPGTFNQSRTRWRADNLLQPGTRYIVAAKATDAAGQVARQKTRFRTQDLTLNQQTYPSIAPLQGETVGVGMPVIVKFDVAVTNRAAIERHLHVTATPATRGSWHWISDHEVHWRPVHFWKPGTHVHVAADINGVNAGHGIYGQLNNQASFVVGRSVIIRPNLHTDEMKVFISGKLARTIPITGGKPGFETRGGIKLIVEKYRSLRMNAATVGIQPGSPNYYNIPDVKYAQRVTFSGEFLHAAPWSTYAQGHYNVSHGCVGMSTPNARWLFHLTHRGDPVIVTGTPRPLDPNNGWTDWNESFAQYRQGSALH